MAGKTTNYNLNTIDLTDSPPDITVLNENAEIIDAEMKALSDSLGAAAQEETLTALSEKVGTTNDSGGTASGGSVFAKLNKIISDLATHMGRWTSARAAKLDAIGSTTDTGGSETSGTVMAKLNELLKSSINKVIFTSNGTFTVPEGVTEIYITACGGGGGGQGGSHANQGKGGGGADFIVRKKFAVTPNDVLTITVGAGGSGGALSTTSTQNSGENGNATIISPLITIAGGFADGSPSGDGGKGGSAGYTSSNSSYSASAARILEAACDGAIDFALGLKGIAGRGTSGGFNGGGGGGSLNRGTDGGTDGVPPKNAPIGGGGGGGGFGINSSSPDTVINKISSGGNGGDGIVIIEWGDLLGILSSIF